MKHVSQTSAALSNGVNKGVGLGTTSAADVLKYHFFEFTTNIQGMESHELSRNFGYIQYVQIGFNI